MQYLTKYLKDKEFDGDWDAILTGELWKLGRLDVDRAWHAMHYLFTGNSSSWEECNLPFIVTKDEKQNRLLINAVMGGTSIRETIGFMDFAPVKYLIQSETKKIYEALFKVSEEEFKYISSS